MRAPTTRQVIDSMAAALLRDLADQCEVESLKQDGKTMTGAIGQAAGLEAVRRMRFAAAESDSKGPFFARRYNHPRGRLRAAYGRLSDRLSVLL